MKSKTPVSKHLSRAMVFDVKNNNCCYPNIEPAQPEPDIETEIRKLDTKPGYELLVAKSEGPSPSFTFLHLSFTFLHLPSLVVRDSPV